jgi:1-acyl-sn-glycerol-3-phosphate acyltransferase
MKVAGARMQTEAAGATRRARSNPALALWRLGRFALWTLYCYLAYMAARLSTRDLAERRRRAARHTHRWLKGVARISGVTVAVEGELPKPPVLLAPNHLGYLDIMAIGAVCPALFVSKADVQHWPLIGHLFKMSEQVGIARLDRRSVAGVNEKIGERFDAGVPVCVFLEGTSSSGAHVMPFHASLVQSAVQRGVPVLPVGLRWEATAPDTTVHEDVAYWRPEHVLGTHLWRMMGLTGIRVTVVFGGPIAPGETDRKALAALARDQVAHLVESGRTGN